MFAAMLVVRLVSLIVPIDVRKRWLAEWHAELEHAWVAAVGLGESKLSVGARLTIRAMESISDAVWLRSRRIARGRPVEALLNAARGLVRRPRYAVTVIGTLALGIAASTAVFTVIDALMVRPLPFLEPDQLVVISGGQSPVSSVDEDDLAVWRSQDRVFTDVRARTAKSVVLTGAGEARSYRAEFVEPGFLSLLGLRPVLGRPLATEDATGGGRVILLSDTAWREAFGGDPNVVGRSVELDGEPHMVVGVLPPTLRLMPGGIVHLVLPLSDPPPRSGVTAIGRLRNDVSLELAQARLDEVATALSVEHPTATSRQVRLWPISRAPDAQIQQGLLALAVAVACLLLISYANAAGLLLLRGFSRRPELQLRVALGASRRSILGQLLAESSLLAVAAGSVGTLWARWGVEGLVSLLPSYVVRFSYNTISLDGRVLGFALLLTLVTGVVFGLAPAWRAADAATGATGRTATRSRQETRLLASIEVSQVALALVLLVGAGLFSKSFGRLMAADPGYDAGQVLQLELVSLEALKGEAATLASAQELDDRLRALPGVSSVSRAWPGTGMMFDFTLETSEREAWEPTPNILPFMRVDTAYFRTMGIGIAEGRAFAAGDIAAEGAVVIDRDLAQALWPNESAVGRRFRIRSDPWLTVVGVTEDVQLDGPREPLGSYLLFYPATQQDLRSGMIVIRSATEPATLAPAVRELVMAVDPDQPIRTLRTGAVAIQETSADPRLLAVITTVIAGAATFLAAVGIFGLISFSVAQRRREIGVRIALGAWAGQVMFEVLRSALCLGVLGIALGLAVIVFASRFLTRLLYETPPWDPGVLAWAALTLLMACSVAVMGPARRAAAADPAEALRAE